MQGIWEMLRAFEKLETIPWDKKNATEISGRKQDSMGRLILEEGGVGEPPPRAFECVASLKEALCHPPERGIWVEKKTISMGIDLLIYSHLFIRLSSDFSRKCVSGPALNGPGPPGVRKRQGGSNRQRSILNNYYIKKLFFNLHFSIYKWKCWGIYQGIMV